MKRRTLLWLYRAQMVFVPLCVAYMIWGIATRDLQTTLFGVFFTVAGTINFINFRLSLKRMADA